MVNLDTFAMANLIAGKKIVTELIQRDFTAQSVVRELEAILPDGARRTRMLEDLDQVRARLHDPTTPQEPTMRAAQEILAALQSK